MANLAAAHCSFDYEIRGWTGFILNQSSRTFAIGNDAVQLVEAIIDVYREPRACGVAFMRADQHRGGTISAKVNGFSSVFASLASGRIAIRNSSLMLSRTPATLPLNRASHYGERYNLFKPMLSVVLGIMDTVLYEKLLHLHLWPHIEQRPEYTEYNGPPLDDTLVVYLRSDDAANRVAKWFPEWKASTNCSYFDRCISHSGLRKLVVVTRVSSGPDEHPLLHGLRSSFGSNLRIQSGTMAEDFATLTHAQHLCLDFSTFGIVAALLNRNLRSVYMQRIFQKYDRLPEDDLGWTVPATPQRAVYIIEPGNVRKGTCPAPITKPLSARTNATVEELAMQSDCKSVKHTLPPGTFGCGKGSIG